METRSEHCKIYIEPSLKGAIKEYQEKHHIESFSEAGRRLWLAGLQAEKESAQVKIYEGYPAYLND